MGLGDDALVENDDAVVDVHAADGSREPQFTDTSNDVPSIYHKTLTRHVRGKAAEASPVLVAGPGAPATPPREASIIGIRLGAKSGDVSE